MKILLQNTYKNKYIELLPTITFSWEKTKVLSLLWLFWSITFTFKKNEN